MDYFDIGQIRLIFDVVGSQHISPHSDKFKKSSEEWLLEKQQSYQGTEYVQKLEEGLIYEVENTFGYWEMIAQYFCYGEPRIKNPNEFSAFFSGCNQFYGKIHQQEYLEYLHTGKITRQQRPNALLLDIQAEFNIRPFHSEPNTLRYQGFYLIQQKGDMLRYIDELEYNCKFYYGTRAISEAYLGIFFQMTDLAKSANSIPIQAVMDTVIERVDIRTKLSLNLLYFSCEMTGKKQ